MDEQDPHGSIGSRATPIMRVHHCETVVVIVGMARVPDDGRELKLAKN